MASLPVPPGAAPDQVALGGRIFNCFGCHGSDAKGSPQAPALVTGEWLNSDGSVSRIKRTITDGMPKHYSVPMPARGVAPLSRPRRLCLGDQPSGREVIAARHISGRSLPPEVLEPNRRCSGSATAVTPRRRCVGILRLLDARQRGMERDSRMARIADRAFSRSRRRGRRHPAHLALEAANRRRHRSVAVDALAGTDHDAKHRRRSRAGTGDGRISHPATRYAAIRL
jgi:hypothetical protein